MKIHCYIVWRIMEDQKFDIDDFETIFKKDHKCNSLLYNNAKISIKQTNTPQDVLKIVSLQVKAIQMADSGNIVKDLNNQRKSNVLTQEKLAVYNKVLLQKVAMKKFETQCVSDTQLIGVVKVAEAFEADTGVTQDVDVSFTVSDLEKMIKEKSKNICNDERMEDGDQALAINNDDDNINGLENTLMGFTEDFTKSNLICCNKTNDDGEVGAIISKNTDKTENIDGIETTIVGFTEDFVESDKDIFDDNDYACSDDDFDIIERDRCISLSPILNTIEPIKTGCVCSISRERDKERSLSPVLGAKIIRKSKSPSPLVFNLDSFEKFEQLALPIIEDNNDLKTVKHLINSQILEKELFLPSKAVKDVAPHTTQLDIENTWLNIGANHENLEDEKTSISNSGDFKLKADREKHNSTLEDEILFSSDEEIYEHKEIQDLPFTCALETSFYEQPDILDTTMYVGFQTASNKSIQVHTESFTKAKSILNEIDTNGKKEIPLTELVNICDSVAKSEQSRLKIRHQDNLNQTEKDTSFEIPDISISKLNKLTGLVTNECPEDKSATMTDLKGCKNYVFEKNTQYPYIDMSMLNTDIGKESKERNNQLISPMKYENVSESVLKTKLCNNNQGFKTASNKIIKLSNAALATCQKVFQNINLDENFDVNYHNDPTSKKVVTKIIPGEHLKSLKTGYYIGNDDIQTDINDEIILKEFENIEMTVDEKDINGKQFRGFQTAGNKNVRISDKAIDKSRQIFDEFKLDLDGSDHLKPIKKLTMSNNKDGYSKETINALETKSNENMGFKTASNKNIKISDKVIAETRNLFIDIELGDLVHTGKDTRDISEQIKPHKTNVDDFVKPSTSTGFKTASNKIIRISNEALVKTKNIFMDLDQYNDLNVSLKKSPLNIVGFQAANNKRVHVSVKTSERSKEIFQEEIFDSRNKNICVSKPEVVSGPNISFQTNYNKSVHIPKKALERTRRIFQNLDNVEFNHKLDKVSENKTPFGFKTANNNEVKISQEALAKTKLIFNDIDVNDIAYECQLPGFSSNSTKHTFKGFQTASNKDVIISKESLDRVKNIFQDIDFSDDLDGDVTKNSTFDENKHETVSMSGFKTANNKLVQVSLKSLARSKRLFKDIDDIHNAPVIGRDLIYTTSTKEICPVPSESKEFIDKVGSGFAGFKTASNKKVAISEEALAKSKQMFQDIDGTDLNEKIDKKNDINAPPANIDYNNVTKKIKPNDIHIDKNISFVKDVSDSINKENIADIINTQVLNNFEDTLYTEDFREVPLRNKRSGSPILSCSSAKRKRFITPFKVNPVEASTKIILNSVKCNESTIFTKNYKKYKKYTLKDLISLKDDNNPIDAYLTNFDFDTLLNFEFEHIRNDITAHKMHIESLKDTFLSSTNKKLVPKGWLDNHIQLILWKLISYEVRFPKLGVVCTARNLMNQLKHRYDKELYNAERPALRKILEKDDVPSKTLVLCVVAILDDGIKIHNSATTTDNVELVLTDGWYCVTTCIDKMLLGLVRSNKIVVGSKIVTNGAELLNCEQGVAPWEDTSSVRLKIFGNSTRRARWDARLGYHGNGAMLTQLSNIKLDGGKVSKLRLFVARAYPALYVEKFEDGSTVTRSERLEHLHQIKYEADRQNTLERLYEEVEKEFSDQESQDSESTWVNKRSGLQSGSQIFEAVKTSKDSSDLRNQLTSSQTKLLEAHNNKRREQLLEKVHAKLMDKIDRSGLRQGRNVVTVLKIRVVGLEEKNGVVVVTRGLLSVWKPNDALLDLIKEDTWIEVMNVVPTAMRYSEIQISAGRQSVFKQSKFKESDRMKTHIETLKRKCYTIKKLNIPQKTDYNEVDTAGIIFLIDPSVQKFESKSQFQNVYLADKDYNMICVNFWGGLVKFGFQNVLDTGQMVACINLQKRAGNTRNVPQYRATEFTYFTKTPKHRQAKEMIDELNKISVLDRRRICEECVKLKNNFSTKSNESITPYRMNIELGKNRAFIDSVEKIAYAELNLTGLDFESTFKQDEELSPKTLKRKREVNNRINKLKMYGDPPALSPIHIINKSKNAFNSYKSPLVNSDVSPNVSSNKNIEIGRNVENQTTPVTKQDNVSVASSKFNRNIENKDSPVTSLNKTYVKSSVNPVKLNFDNNASDVVDQFAEEFDASPPLSLD